MWAEAGGGEELTVDGPEGGAGDEDGDDPGHPSVQSVGECHRHGLRAQHFRYNEGNFTKLLSTKHLLNCSTEKTVGGSVSLVLFPESCVEGHDSQNVDEEADDARDEYRPGQVSHRILRKSIIIIITIITLRLSLTFISSMMKLR